MKQVNLSLHYLVYDLPGDLPVADQELLKFATEAISNAYAPYSGYKVGAAVLLENGQIIQGNNQENAAYPSGTCAERVALFYAASQYPDVSVKAVAVTASTDKFRVSDPVTPCGSCRQVMAETEIRFGSSIRVIMRGETGKIYVVKGVNNLLPLMFHTDKLKKYIHETDLD